MRRELQELRTLAIEELRARLSDAEQELGNLKFQLGSHQLESPIKVRTQRKVVARLYTIIREKELTTTSSEAVDATAESKE